MNDNKEQKEDMHPFDYENLSDSITQEHNDFMTVYTGQHIQLMFSKYNGDKQYKARKAGWKFHISIDDRDKKNLAKGWNHVREILMKHGVYISKVIPPNAFVKRDDQGKQITIFAYKESIRKTQDWENIIQKITKVLTNNGVKPGPKAKGDKQIMGSNYVSYRNDNSVPYSEDPKGNYFEGSTNYNPGIIMHGGKYKGHKDFKDEFQAIKVQVPNQPTPPKLDEFPETAPEDNDFSKETKDSKPATDNVIISESENEENNQPKQNSDAIFSASEFKKKAKFTYEDVERDNEKEKTAKSSYIRTKKRKTVAFNKNAFKAFEQSAKNEDNLNDTSETSESLKDNESKQNDEFAVIPSKDVAKKKVEPEKSENLKQEMENMKKRDDDDDKDDHQEPCCKCKIL